MLCCKYISSISQFINNLCSCTYCSYTFRILFHSEPKITLFYLLSFVSIRFHSFYHSLSFVIIRYHSFYHSLSLVVPLVVIRCHSVSFVLPRCHSLFHSLSLVGNRSTTRLSFYKRSFLCDNQWKL